MAHSNLDFLALELNLLTKIPDVVELPLRELQLQENNIAFINSSILSALPLLEEISLQGNLILNFRDFPHQALTNLQGIKIQDIELQCDCSMRWLKELELSGVTVNVDEQPCMSPAGLVEASWNALVSEDFGTDCTDTTSDSVTTNTSAQRYQYETLVVGELITELMVKQELQCALQCIGQANCIGFQCVSVENLYRCLLLGLPETFSDTYSCSYRMLSDT